MMQRSCMKYLPSAFCTRVRPTGVTVVSSQPQSTTRPVMRPHAARESSPDEAKDSDGTYV